MKQFFSDDSLKCYDVQWYHVKMGHLMKKASFFLCF